MTKRVFLVAAEPSGDVLGKEVATHLRALSNDIELAGIGGHEMVSAGLKSSIDTSPLSVLGLFEGLKVYPKVIKIADACADEIIAFKPDAVVLIDSWGFMLRVAQRLRKRAPNIHLIKLIGPQVWATRAGRAKTLAGTVDHLLAMFEMEVPYYQPYGLKTTVIGNPALGRSEKGDGIGFRDQHNIPQDKKVVLVLPGSRPGEIKRIAPTLVRAAKQISQKRKDFCIIIQPASPVLDMFMAMFPDASNFATVLGEASNRYDAMAAADIALACSGTVTTELALQGTPFLVGYKLGWITWAIARGFLYKPDYMTILNVAANKEIAPEFLQTKFTSAEITAQALELLNNHSAHALQIEEQNRALDLLGISEIAPAEIAARAILNDLDN